MKLKYIIVILLMITTAGYIIGNTQTKQADIQKQNQKAVIAKTTGQAPAEIKAGDGHSKLPLECKTCHSCDFPTKANPCLILCPRKDLISIEHKPEEGPNVVPLNQSGKQYGKVIFSHKIHAQMADISIGCEGCHHYNTTGPIDKCSKCHEASRKRTDISRPDLKGAMHRQCFTCHQEWNHLNDCSYCHLPMSKDSPKLVQNKINLLSDKNHPELAAQPKIVYDTKYEAGKTVTFFHDEHVKTFGIACKTCHQNDNCTKCHDANVTYDKPRKHNLAGKSQDEIHKNCNSCHKDNSCTKCHYNGEKEKFNHKQATGFDLGKNHSKLTCTKCHNKTNPMDKPNASCVSCHKNFVLGKFKHAQTGLKLDELHIDFDCNSCHPNNNFSQKPVCSDCHDGYSYPKQKPGSLIKK